MIELGGNNFTMELKNKTILLISRDKWGYLSLSKHNYARELAKDNTVYFLEPNTKHKSYVCKESGVIIINNYFSIKGISKLPSFLAKFFMRIEVNSILKQIKHNKIDLVWSFDSSRLFYLDVFKSNKSIAHIMDYTENFNFKPLVKSADVCISVADCILDRMNVLNSNVFKIEHGFSLNQSSNIEERIEKYETPTGVYVGNLNMPYVDWESLFLLSNSNEHIIFNFYGPLTTETVDNEPFLKKMKNCDNVFFKGFLSPDLVNMELRKSTFCIVCYLHEKYGRQLDNSHKIIQYLGSGTPIFSSFTYEYRNDDLLFMYKNREKVLKEFENFMNLESVHFTKVHKEKRVNYALSNTYEKQVKKIEEILNK